MALFALNIRLIDRLFRVLFGQYNSLLKIALSQSVKPIWVGNAWYSHFQFLFKIFSILTLNLNNGSIIHKANIISHNSFPLNINFISRLQIILFAPICLIKNFILVFRLMFTNLIYYFIIWFIKKFVCVWFDLLYLFFTVFISLSFSFGILKI